MASFDYERDTKNRYKKVGTGQDYHRLILRPSSWEGFRFWLIAQRERATIRKFIEEIGPSSILDVPCGTGKLASVFKFVNADITCCDISADMLAIAKESFRKENVVSARFIEADAEKLVEHGVPRHDLVVCLRLLHRVPEEKWCDLLDSMFRIAPVVVASFGLNSAYHRVRRRARSLIFRSVPESLCYVTREKLIDVLSPRYVISKMRSVAPFLSQEIVIMLLKKDP